jgi:hypothetical protein
VRETGEHPVAGKQRLIFQAKKLVTGISNGRQSAQHRGLLIKIIKQG